MNSSTKTGRVHDQVVSAHRGNSQRSKCADSGRASRDILPTNRHGRTASAKRGGPATAVMGRVSGTQEMHANSSLVRKQFAVEPHSVDDMAMKYTWFDIEVKHWQFPQWPGSLMN